MNTDSNAANLSEWEIDRRSKRNHLDFCQYHLVMVRGLMRQWGLTNDQAHAMAMSRFPMSSHTAIDEIAVRGLQVSQADIEEFWFELHGELVEMERLQWSAKSIENFITWAVARERAKPIAGKTPYIKKLLSDREFIQVAYEMESEILQTNEDQDAL